MTQRTDRRANLHFESLEDALIDIEQLDRNGEPRANGNWSAGQVAQHIAKLINLSIDGFGGKKAPLLIRLIAGLMTNRFLHNPMKPGVRLPGGLSFLLPDDNVSWPEGRDALRAAIERLQAERAVAPSPVFGKLTHEEWVRLHLRHMEMHLSFLHAGILTTDRTTSSVE